LKVAYSRPQSKDIQNSNLYVTNIPPHWTNDRLVQLFKPFGFVVESRILLDENEKSRGVGFVRMDNHINALKAVSSTRGYRIDGETELIVKVSYFTFPLVVTNITLFRLIACKFKSDNFVFVFMK
ncbi:hypothetical protein RFI_17363, partial [Reticulomyxa filosa]